MSAFDPKRTFQSHRRMSAFGGKADMPFCTAKADFDILHSRLKANRFQIGKAVHTKAVLRDLHASKSALPAKRQPRTFAGGVSREAPAPGRFLKLDLGPMSRSRCSIQNSHVDLSQSITHHAGYFAQENVGRT